MAVALVTDSTAYLPVDLAAEHGIHVVPVDVIIGDSAMRETDDPDGTAVAAALRSHRRVTTSRATPEAFEAAFRAAVSGGADAIVCATLSADMSATFESALVAARRTSVPVEVIDSRSIAMALGFAVIAGARAASAGAGAGEVAEIVRATAVASTVIFYVDTLEYLRKGGRIGSAGAALGSALHVKPLLQVSDGRVSVLERVRTSGRALMRMTELAVTAAAGRDVQIAVQDIDSRERADAVADHLRRALPGTPLIRGPLGAAVGAHTGPGAVAIIIAPISEAPPTDRTPFAH